MCFRGESDFEAKTNLRIEFWQKLVCFLFFLQKKRFFNIFCNNIVFAKAQLVELFRLKNQTHLEKTLLNMSPI